MVEISIYLKFIEYRWNLLLALFLQLQNYRHIKESYLRFLLSFINMNLLINYNDYQAFIATHFQWPL